MVHKNKTIQKWLSIAITLLPSSNAMAQVKLHFASKEEAQRMIVENDAYTNGLGQFDLDSRVGRTNANKAELHKFQKDQCLEFEQEEKDSIAHSMARLQAFAEKNGFHLPMPEEIVFVKTTMAEEGGAGGYTRQNRIYMQSGLHTHKSFDNFVAHELFHVLTRNSRAFKEAMYSIISFKLLDESITFSKEIIDMRISNPDISRYDAYAELTVAGEKRPCTMMIYANKSYEGGSFFSYLQLGLIPLDKDFKPVMEDGKTVIYPLSECSDFYDKVGQNTSYVINPEECLADNFCFVMTGKDSNDFKTPSILEAIKNTLREFAEEDELPQNSTTE